MIQMQLVKADGKAEYALLEQLAARSGEVDRQVTAAVTEILDTVRRDGDAAVREYTRRFDGVDAPLRRISRQELAEMAAGCEKKVYAALQRAADNIRDFHQRQVQQSWLTTKEDGTILGQRIRGLSRVGVYVPGGTAAYPSSVLMNAIPARIAGVEEIVMVTPPPKNGDFNADVMAAAYIAGVDAVYLCGGAQAVAALAYGTGTIPQPTTPPSRPTWRRISCPRRSMTGWPPPSCSPRRRTSPAARWRSWISKSPPFPGRTSSAPPWKPTGRLSSAGTWTRQ